MKIIKLIFLDNIKNKKILKKNILLYFQLKNTIHNIQSMKSPHLSLFKEKTKIF